jgi:ferrous iron transport protein A
VRRLDPLDLPLTAHDEPVLAARLSDGRRGFAGVIAEVRPGAASGGLGGAEIERRLIEMGLVEGAPVEIVHEGLFGRDPIAVKLADRTVALRRREAQAVLVRPGPGR